MHIFTNFEDVKVIHNQPRIHSCLSIMSLYRKSMNEIIRTESSKPYTHIHTDTHNTIVRNPVTLLALKTLPLFLITQLLGRTLRYNYSSSNQTEC